MTSGENREIHCLGRIRGRVNNYSYNYNYYNGISRLLMAIYMYSLNLVALALRRHFYLPELETCYFHRSYKFSNFKRRQFFPNRSRYFSFFFFKLGALAIGTFNDSNKINSRSERFVFLCCRFLLSDNCVAIMALWSTLCNNIKQLSDNDVPMISEIYPPIHWKPFDARSQSALLHRLSISAYIVVYSSMSAYYSSNFAAWNFHTGLLLVSKIYL